MSLLIVTYLLAVLSNYQDLLQKNHYLKNYLLLNNMDNKAEARKILTSIKLGSSYLSDLYNIVWGDLEGTYCLSQNGRALTNAEALNIIESKLAES